MCQNRRDYKKNLIDVALDFNNYFTTSVMVKFDKEILFEHQQFLAHSLYLSYFFGFVLKEIAN